MAYGPRSSRTLILVDVSAPGEVIWVIDPVLDPISGKVQGRLRLPTTDAKGTPLTGLANLAVAYNLNSGFSFDATMEQVLEDSANGRIIIPVTPEQGGTEVDFEVDPLGTSGEMFFTAACAD